MGVERLGFSISLWVAYQQELPSFLPFVYTKGNYKLRSIEFLLFLYLMQHKDISIPSCTLFSLFSKVSSTSSRTLSSIFPGSVIWNSLTVLLSAFEQTTLTSAPGHTVAGAVGSGN